VKCPQVFALIEGVEIVELVELAPNAWDTRVLGVICRKSIRTHIIVYRNHAKMFVHAWDAIKKGSLFATVA
jgi:hypothetical protein